MNKETALSPQALASAIETQGITSMFVTTALFLLMAKEAPRAFRSLRHQLTGGEALSPSRMREALTHSIGNGPGEALRFAPAGECYRHVGSVAIRLPNEGEAGSLHCPAGGAVHCAGEAYIALGRLDARGSGVRGAGGQGGCGRWGTMTAETDRIQPSVGYSCSQRPDPIDERTQSRAIRSSGAGNHP